jgi:nitronate monooxygenase
MAIMTRQELGALLNTLLEAERAGAKLLAAYLNELPPSSKLHGALLDVQRDEARNCAVLIHFLLEADVAPSTATGDFHRKGLLIDGWSERLEFLNRGQAWVARRIAAALPRIASLAAKYALQAMHESHLVNIRACENLLPAPGTPAHAAASDVRH